MREIPPNVTINPSERLAVIEFRGVVSGPMILAAAGRVHADPAWQDGFDVVWNCGAVLAHDILPPDVGPIVDAEVGSGDGHDVLVCSPTFGDRAISEMLAAMCRRRGKAMTVHASLAEALAALGRDQLPEGLVDGGLRPSPPIPLVSVLPQLVTDRLRLRPFTDSDAPFLLDLLTQPSFIENIADRGVRSLEDALAYLHGRLQQPAMPGIGMWAVEAHGGGPTLGMVGLVLRDGLDGPDLGYAFLPGAWGHGYAREASYAIVAYARDALGLERLFAIVTPGHTPSIRVLEHLGMAFDRTLTLAGDDEVALYDLALTGGRTARAS